MDILQYINKMNRLYGNDTQLAAFGTQDTYGAPEELSPTPNWRDLIREEGVQVGEQVKASSNPLNIPAHMQHQMEGGQLTPEEFYQNQSIPITERPLTGAEGGRVYDTRKYFSRGQLVQPGPGRPGFMEGKLVTQGKHKGDWVIYHSTEGTKYFKKKKLMDKWIKDRPGKGDPT